MYFERVRLVHAELISDHVDSVNPSVCDGGDHVQSLPVKLQLCRFLRSAAHKNVITYVEGDPVRRLLAIGVLLTPTIADRDYISVHC